MSQPTLCEILQISIPAIILNAAPTATSMIQTGLLGHHASTAQLAAFGAVATTAGTLLSVFNFLTDGVAAKVGLAVGQRDWASFAARVRMAITWYTHAHTHCGLQDNHLPPRPTHPQSHSAFLAGITSCTLLLASQHLVLLRWLHLDPHVLHPAASYLVLRALLLPLQLGNTAVNGILQGYRRVGVSAALVTIQEASEIAGSVAVLRFGVGPARGLLGLGVVQLCTAGTVLVGGLCCVVGLPPGGMPATCGVVSWGHHGKGRGEEGVDTTPLLDGSGGGGGVEESVCRISDTAHDAYCAADDANAITNNTVTNNTTTNNTTTNNPTANMNQQSHWWDFIVDGGNMLIRSLCLQVVGCV